ncbi:tyrosine-type recombinase/integrase [Parasphingorhabdus sp.]|uniref:tyrosine-type recombinase/integrase n=1 Tax=Parasphingorhabdus sp. TaxID=2709688 RepID=UPI002F9420D0
MRKVLTAKTIDALKPREKRYEVRDASLPGFAVRVSTNGQRTFTQKFRLGLKQGRHKLGVYPRISLAEARNKAIEVLRLVDEGIDPATTRRQLDMRVCEVCAQFIEQYAKPRNRSYREAERILQREFVSAYGEMDIRKIKRCDLLALMDAAVARGSKYQANRIHAHLRKLMNWCVERSIIDLSPLNGVSAPSVETKRRRILTDDEITRVLAASINLAFPYRYVVPMLLATAQRRSEVANMRWSEIDLKTKTWTLPAERSKNGEENAVPLNEMALQMLEEMPRFEGSDLIFTTNGTSPINGFSKFLGRLQDGSETANWRLHDLRRTAASGMARASVPPHVIEKVLNHISGTISGVAAVYNRYGYDAEKRAALDKWGKHLETLFRTGSFLQSD